MSTVAARDTEKALRHLTLDYSSGHVLIDGRPIGCFVAEQGPEIVASPAPDLYIVNVPLMVKSVTFLPSGEHFTARAPGINQAWAKVRDSFSAVLGPTVKYSADDVRLALAQAVKERSTVERVLTALDEVAP